MADPFDDTSFEKFETHMADDAGVAVRDGPGEPSDGQIDGSQHEAESGVPVKSGGDGSTFPTAENVLRLPRLELGQDLSIEGLGAVGMPQVEQEQSDGRLADLPELEVDAQPISPDVQRLENWHDLPATYERAQSVTTDPPADSPVYESPKEEPAAVGMQSAPNEELPDMSELKIDSAKVESDKQRLENWRDLPPIYQAAGLVDSNLAGIPENGDRVVVKESRTTEWPDGALSVSVDEEAIDDISGEAARADERVEQPSILAKLLTNRMSILHAKSGEVRIVTEPQTEHVASHESEVSDEVAAEDRKSQSGIAVTNNAEVESSASESEALNPGTNPVIGSTETTGVDSSLAAATQPETLAPSAQLGASVEVAPETISQLAPYVTENVATAAPEPVPDGGPADTMPEQDLAKSPDFATSTATLADQQLEPTSSEMTPPDVISDETAADEMGAKADAVMSSYGVRELLGPSSAAELRQEVVALMMAQPNVESLASRAHEDNLASNEEGERQDLVTIELQAESGLATAALYKQQEQELARLLAMAAADGDIPSQRTELAAFGYSGHISKDTLPRLIQTQLAATIVAADLHENAQDLSTFSTQIAADLKELNYTAEVTGDGAWVEPAENGEGSRLVLSMSPERVVRMTIEQPDNGEAADRELLEQRVVIS